MSKKILKKIIPATFDKVEKDNRKIAKQLEKTFDNHIDRSLKEQQKTNKAEIRKAENNIVALIRECITRVRDVIWKLDHNFPKIHKELSQISDQLEQVPKKYEYNNNYERKVITSFYEMYERPDFKEKFLNLIEGLDPEDVEEIVKILQRQRLVKDTMGQKVDLFSEEEQKQILEMDRELKQQIFRVADDMYCYKHYFLPIRHFEARVFIYKHGIDCIEHPESIQNKDILDVGGYIGDSILILKPLTQRRVYSFEATEKNFTLMKETIKLNHLENVIPEHMALGREKGSMEMKLAGPSSAFHENGVATVTGTETVQVDTLDAYMEGTDIEVGLIKVDIEGAEQDFLAGARKTIEKHKPVLLMSIYHNADDFFDIKPIIESWNLGYKFRIHKPVDYSVSREVLLIAEVR